MPGARTSESAAGRSRESDKLPIEMTGTQDGPVGLEEVERPFEMDWRDDLLRFGKPRSTILSSFSLRLWELARWPG